MPCIGFLASIIIFESDQASQKTLVPLVQDELWHTTLEFGVDLLQDGLKNGVHGRYLWHARVKVLDDECFPTNRFADPIRNGQIKDVPEVKLLIECAVARDLIIKAPPAAGYGQLCVG